MNIELSFKSHLWIGTSLESDANYMEYFKLDYSSHQENGCPKHKKCRFCIDIGIDWYDEDYITIIPRFAQEVDLDTLLMTAPVRTEEKNNIKMHCANLGVKKANAIFCYSEPNLIISEPHKASYNGLKYIGIYEG